MPADSAEITAIRALAADHGLDIVPETITVNELGLVFQVAIAEAADGQSWVLRIPRGPHVTDRAAVEGRFLRAVAPHLSVEVPDWRIHTEDLIAYPLLPAELHAVDSSIVRASGIEEHSPAEVRQRKRDDIARVVAEAFDATIQRYVEKGGKAWPKLAEHCGELFSTSPVELGLYALQTGDSDHMEAARAQLSHSE